MKCPFEIPVKPKNSWEIIAENGNHICFTNSTEQRNYIVQAINSHKKSVIYKTEREAIFVLLNEKQLPIIGGMCLDSIISDLVKQFERRQAFIEEHDKAEAYREYEVYCKEQELEQASPKRSGEERRLKNDNNNTGKFI